MTVKKLVKVYMDYPNYIQPKEVTKAFKLYDKWSNTNNKTVEAATMEELKLLLKVMCADGDYNYLMSNVTETSGKKINILQIYEEVSESMFIKPQDDL